MSTNIKDVVKEKYGEAALRVLNGGSSCCGASAACGTDVDPITSHIYDEAQAVQIPEEALKASFGCGNPTALAALNPGRVDSRRPHAAGSDRSPTRRVRSEVV